MPIYVSLDSADVWAHPELFQLDAQRRPAAVSGVPPDYFSETGQLWGNPLYRWDRFEETGYAWWVGADPGEPAALRPPAHRSLPRVRGVLVGPGDGGDRAQRKLAAGPRREALRRRARGARRRAAADRRRGPRRHHRRGPRPARRARRARDEGPAVRASTRRTASTCRTGTPRTPSSTPARTTTTRRAAGTRT